MPDGFTLPQCSLLFGGFLAARADVVGHEAKRLGDPAHLFVIVAFVQAEVLRGYGGGFRPVDGDAPDSFREQLEVVFVGPGHG